MTLISIEGNIGAGKSTLIETLKTKFSNVVFVDEPVDEWSTVTDRDGTTILEKYYADQKRYAFAFQMMAFITRVSRLRRAIEENPGKIIVTERSVFTDREIFAKMLHDEGKIEDIEYSIYLKWFDELVGDIRVDGIIYVRVTPDVAYQRVVGRNRPGETIPLDYLEMCHTYHERWLVPKMMTHHFKRQEPMTMSEKLSFDIDGCDRVIVNPTEDRIRTWFRLLPLARV